LLGYTSKNKAKTAILVAVAAKPEVEIWRRPQNELFDPDFLFTPSESFLLGRTVLPQYIRQETAVSVAIAAKPEVEIWR